MFAAVQQDLFMYSAKSPPLHLAKAAVPSAQTESTCLLHRDVVIPPDLCNNRHTAVHPA